MSITGAFSVAGAIFGLLGLVGGAVAYLAAMRQKTTIQVLETDNNALRNRVGTIEALERDCQTRLSNAETSVRVLTETITNTKAVNDLLTRVDLQHADLKSLAQTTEAHFTQIHERFAQVHSLLDKKAPA